MFLIKMHWFHLFIVLKKEKKLKILIKIMDIILKNLNKNISNQTFLNMTKMLNHYIKSNLLTKHHILKDIYF